MEYLFTFLLILAIGCIFVIHTKVSDKGRLLLGISAVVALILYCGTIYISCIMFSELGKYPFRLPASIILGALSFVLLIVMMVVYIKNSMNEVSRKIICLDVIMILIYVVLFFGTYITIHMCISKWLATYYDKIG